MSDSWLCEQRKGMVRRACWGRLRGVWPRSGLQSAATRSPEFPPQGAAYQLSILASLDNVIDPNIPPIKWKYFL